MVATQGAGWTLAPSLAALIDEADRLWPARSHTSDGSIGDPAHAARTSDHNPLQGFVHAVDLTDDPAHGVDTWVLANRIKARADQRVQYLVVWSPELGRDAIWNPDVSPAWRDKGTSDHASHLHVSIRHTDAARADVRPWWPQEDDLPYSEQQLVAYATVGTLAALKSDAGHGEIVQAVARALADPESPLSNRVEWAVKRAVKELLSKDPDGKRLVDGK